jgi:hypothetical protein
MNITKEITTNIQIIAPQQQQQQTAASAPSARAWLTGMGID